MAHYEAVLTIRDGSRIPLRGVSEWLRYPALFMKIVAKASAEQSWVAPGGAGVSAIGTSGTDDGAVNHDGIIVLGWMKLQHHLASHRNTLAGAHAAPSE